MGVTLATWKSQGYDKDKDGDIDVADLKIITKEDVKERVLRPHYWNRCKADQINDQSVANLLVDWTWTSGVRGIKELQKILGLTQDGIVGPNTLHAINSHKSPGLLFAELKNARTAFLKRIGVGSQQKFLAGWLNRQDGIQYGRLVLNDKGRTVVTW